MARSFTIRFASFAAALLVLAGAAAAQTAIRLNPRAQVVPGASVRLADIATLSGTDAERLGGVVILPTSAGTGEVSVSAVRAALKDQNVNWATVTLAGSRCVLESEKLAVSAPGKQPSPRPAPGGGHEEIEPDTSTMRGLVGRRLAEFYGVSADDLRVKFSASGKADPMLHRAIQDGERVEVSPSGSAGSGRLPIRITVLDESKIVASGAVTAEVLVRRETVNLIASIERDEVIVAKNLGVQTVWLPPSAISPLTLEQAVGRTAGRRLPAGETIDGSDVQSIASIRKGDEIMVRCVVGTISIETRAYALTDGKVGETIALAVDKTKDRKPFMAQLTGRGTATRIDAGSQATPSRLADALSKPSRPVPGGSPRASDLFPR